MTARGQGIFDLTWKGILPYDGSKGHDASTIEILLPHSDNR